MKNIFIFIFISLVNYNLLYSQVGINIEDPDPSSALEITSTSKGLLIPRVALKSNKDTNTISSPANSLLIYNTGTSENSVSDNEKVTPGYYYWSKDENTPTNSKWVRLSSGTYTAGQGMTLTDTEFSRNGLQELNSTGNTIVRTATSTGNYGWRYIGLNQKNYARIGKYATDLSYAPTDVDISSNHDFDALNAAYSTAKYSAVKTFNSELIMNQFGASGKYSFASGLMNNGIGDYSFTVGLANYNESALGISMGNFNITKGKYSITIGSGNEADPKATPTAKNPSVFSDPYQSYIIGVDNKSNGSISVVLGSANGNTNIGATGAVTGTQAVVIGRANGATGENSIAIGTRNLPSALYAVTIGAELTADSYGSSALGYNNTIEDQPEKFKTNINKEKRVFVLGNGFGEKSDALTILRNGQMGVDIDNFETNYTSDISKGHIKDVKLQVNGTAQLRTLPKSGENNYLPNKTIVSDDRGVIGYVNGLPTSYNRKTVPIDNSTPTNSATSLGNLAIRLNGTSDSGEQTLQFKLNNNKSHVTIWGEKMGKGYSVGLNPYARSSYNTVTNTGSWEDTGMGINPKNRDMVRYTFNLHNTKEVYRVSVVSNARIDANSGVDEVPAQITIFIEKLD